jgi:hypothetical protein
MGPGVLGIVKKTTNHGLLVKRECIPYNHNSIHLTLVNMPDFMAFVRLELILQINEERAI